MKRPSGAAWALQGDWCTWQWCMTWRARSAHPSSAEEASDGLLTISKDHRVPESRIDPTYSSNHPDANAAPPLPLPQAFQPPPHRPHTMSSDKGTPSQQALRPAEKAVEGVKGALGTAAQAALEHIPGTAEHTIAKELREAGGDIDIVTGGTRNNALNGA